MSWMLKLKALLHDPPYKAKVIQTHYSEAEELFKIIFPNDTLEDENVNEADRLASAQSRIIVKPQFQDKKKEKEKEFENASQVNYNECQFIDIFSERKEPIQSPNEEKVKELFEKLKNLTFSTPEERAKFIFLFLWRFYPEIFPEIEKHPADSRAPNHSIYDHLVQTSAIVSALPKPAFLLFTIGPVQSFISKARKTSDLWAGSYMLSYLIWNSMKPLVEKFGPDIIIFPNLLRQPLVDRWLYLEVFKNSPVVNLDESKFKEWFEKWLIYEKENKSDDEKDLAKELEEKLLIANLPNRFLAVIPFDKNKSEDCKNAFEKALKDISQKVYEKIKSYSSNSNLQNDIQNQLLNHFQVYWVIMPWVSNPPKDALNDYKELFSENEVYNTINEIVNHPYYKPANVGSAYSLLLELTEKLLGARKSVRDFEPLEQLGEKCHLCGEYEVLWLLSDTSKWKGNQKQKEEDWRNKSKIEENKQLWSNLSSIAKLKQDERLCGICLTKRLFPEIIKEELKLSNEIKFPSTSEMASIGEKRKLSEEIKKEFKNEFKAFCQKIKNKNQNLNLPSSISVPRLKNDILYEIDGQFLMKETYRVDYFEKEYGIKVNESDFQNILETLKKHSINPSKYYAILQADGDNIGKWLRGEFNPKIKDTIHQKVKDALIAYSEGEGREKLQKILCSKHPASPSIHQAFSRRLSTFALEHVRKIVEDDHYGKLVYAGGDDVLAFLPIEEVLNCAYNLQKTFKDVLSPNASMSAGILIVHHKYPLYLALEEVNNAEKRTKKHYGKNGFCLRFLSRSGEQRECGGNWKLVGFINELICKFKNEEISSRFPYDYFEIVEKLYDENEKGDKGKVKEILRSELKRVFFRKVKDKEKVKEFFEEVLKWFDELETYNFANLIIISRNIAGEVKV